MKKLCRVFCLITCMALIMSFTVTEALAVNADETSASSPSSEADVIAPMSETDEQGDATFEIKGLAAKPNGPNSIILSWEMPDPVDTAIEAYRICDADTKKEVATVNVDKMTYTVSGLKMNTTYRYVFYPVVENNDGEPAPFSTDSVEISGTTGMVTSLSTVTGLKAYPGNGSVTLKWTPVENATQYNIFRYNTSKKKWDKIGTSATNTFRNSGLKVTKQMQYRVSATCVAGSKSVTGGVSSIVKGECVRGLFIQAVTKSKSPLYKTSKNKPKAGSIAKGKTIVGLYPKSGKWGFITSNGSTRYVTAKRLKIKKTYYQSGAYTDITKENYVNEGGYSSGSQYLIWLSHYSQRVYVFTGSKGKWKIYKTMPCATGRVDIRYTPTPRGTFKVGKKERTVKRKTHYCDYWTHFKGNTSFHTRTKKYSGGYKNAAMGKPASAGCVRMYDDDAKWIYQNIPTGTTVVSY